MALIKVNNRGQSADFSTEIGATKNLVINGAMNIAQRGNQTGLAEGAYSVDRFRTRTYGGVGRYSGTVLQTDVPSGQNFKYSTLWTVTTVGSDVGTYGYSIEHFIEGLGNYHRTRWGTADAQSVRVSFWVKTSIGGTYSSGFRIKSGTDSYVTEHTIPANTWTKVEYTVPGITSFNSSDDEYVIFDVIALGAQTSKTTSTLNAWQTGNYVHSSNQTNWMGTLNATIYLTGVQVELGTETTDFAHVDYATELAQCQRYYAELPCFSGPGTGTTDTRGYGAHVVQMRVAPTLGVTGPMNITDGYSYDRTQSSASISLITNTVDFSFFNLPNFSSMTNGRIHFGPRNQNANRVTLDSEF